MTERKPWVMRGKRARRVLIMMLGKAEAPMSHTDILNTFNQTTKHGITTSQLANALARDEAFEDAGRDEAASLTGSTYTVKSYTLSERGLELFEEWGGE